MRVVVNCAMTADGKIATIRRKQLSISSEEDLKRVHILRSKFDAILVGVGTVLADDPSLLVKEKYVMASRSPMRVVLDPGLKTPEDARILQSGAPTVVYSCIEGSLEGAEVVKLDGPPLDLRQIMGDLARRRVNTLLVEGGGETIWSFFNAGLVDEYRVFVGSMVVGGRSAPTPVDGDGIVEPMGLRLLSVERLGEGVLLSYIVER